MPQPLVPSLTPSVPRIGERAQLGRPVGAGLALALAQLCAQLRANLENARPLIVVCADAQDVHQLTEEMAWFAPTFKIREFSDWETLPFDHFSPHPDLVSDRLKALYALANNDCDALIVSATTATQKLTPRSFIAARTFSLKKGQRLDVDKLRQQMALGGYANVNQVVSQGEFAVRGGIIDIFPTGALLPVRVDLFDEDIESIKTFEPDSQRTLYPVLELSLLPAREFPTDEAGRTQFRQRFREAFDGDPSKSATYKDVSNGIFPGGIEFYLPLFFDHVETLFTHAPENSVFALVGDVHAALSEFETETASRWGLLRADVARPLLPPSELYLGRDDFLHALKNYSRFEIKGSASNAPTALVAALEIDRRKERPLGPLADYLAAQAIDKNACCFAQRAPGVCRPCLKCLRNMGSGQARLTIFQRL